MLGEVLGFSRCLGNEGGRRGLMKQELRGEARLRRRLSATHPSSMSSGKPLKGFSVPEPQDDVVNEE